MAPVNRKTKHKSGKPAKDSAPDTILDRINGIVDSPLRLAVFCASLLVISLATGMLIGNFVKDGPSDSFSASSPPIRPDLTLASKPEVMEQEVPEEMSEESLPVDALNSDNPYNAEIIGGEETPQAGEGIDQEEEIATLSPDALPQRSSQLPPWQRYAALSEPNDGRPMIAIVIDDVGLNRKRVRDLIALPKVLTLAFLPYAKGLSKSAELTRASGHEVMLHLPMEPLRESADPGPDALREKLSLEEIRVATLKNLAKFEGYVGVNNHMGSKFTAFEPGMAVVMDILSDKGLLFLDSRTTASSKGYRLAKERGMPTGTRDVFLDNIIKETAILKQLAEVEKLAKKKGIAIAIGHPHKETIAALSKWMPAIIDKGFHFIPISAALSINQ